LIGTVETRLGDDVLDVRTTEATDLQPVRLIDRGVTAIAMEGHALAMGRVGGTRFAVGGSPTSASTTWTSMPTSRVLRGQALLSTAGAGWR
jgi:UDP-N-acetylmuramyl tripeptide synthase